MVYEIRRNQGDIAIINLAAVMKIVPLGKGGCRIYFNNAEENVFTTLEYAECTAMVGITLRPQ